jgi:Apc15p protein
MFLPASSTLPLLPPPFTSILSTQYTSSNNLEQSPTGQPAQRRPNLRQPHPSSLRNPNSLYNLQLDEAAISSRKAAISTYGYSWLRPAGVAKTMLGRREEEAEKDEMERQMREQEEMELEMGRVEELTRQARLAEQQQQEQGHGQGVQQRNLDDDIPDADAQAQAEAEAEADADLDDEIPDADADAEADNTFSDEDEDDVEGETGITDEVEHTNLEDGEEQDLSPRPAVATNATTATTTTASTTMAPPSNRRPSNLDARQARALAAQAAHHAHRRRQQQQDLARREQEALANVMLDEDEQGFADRDLDAEIPSENENDEGAEAMEARDLDDDVPDAADEEDEEASGGEWQHTDTELEEDESGIMLTEDVGEDVSMDMMSGVGSAVRGGGRRSTSGRFIAAAAAATASGGNNLPATPTGDPSSTLQTPATGEIGGSGSTGRRRWLNRTSLFGRGRTGNLFAGFTGSGSGSGSPHAPAQIEPRTEEQQEQQQQQQPRRRSARRALGRENQSARESLD